MVALSAVGTAAQEASPEPGASASPAPPEADPVAVLLPVVDYWGEWADHKGLVRLRSDEAIHNVTSAGSKKAPFFRQAASVFRDELAWLDNHRPQDCYRDEYEAWREAVKDLKSIHERAAPLARGKNASGLRRAAKQRRAAVKRLDKASGNAADCDDLQPLPDAQMPAASPIVGSWQSRDNWVHDDGTYDRSRLSFRVDGDGRYLYRDDAAGNCSKVGFSAGLVPTTIRGEGVFGHEDRPLFGATSVTKHCYPRSGGRKPLAPTSPGFIYYEANDILIQPIGRCFWRKGAGSPADCADFWQGIQASMDDAPSSADEAVGPAEDGATRVEEGA